MPLGRSEGSLRWALWPKYHGGRANACFWVKQAGRGLGGEDAAVKEVVHKPSLVHALRQRPSMVLALVPKHGQGTRWQVDFSLWQRDLTKPVCGAEVFLPTPCVSLQGHPGWIFLQRRFGLLYEATFIGVAKPFTSHKAPHEAPVLRGGHGCGWARRCTVMCRMRPRVVQKFAGGQRKQCHHLCSSVCRTAVEKSPHSYHRCILDFCIAHS